MIEPRPGAFTIGGLDAHDLAARFGTPLFVYDAESVRTSYQRVRRAFRYEPSRVHFAAVCNPNLHLLRILREEGAGLHANTPGDVYCGLRAGYAPSDIVFSGSNLGEDDLRYLIDAGVELNVDSLDDLERATRLAPGRDVGLRMHFDQAMPESRVGLRDRDLDDALTIARRSGGRVTSLHVYCGTHGQGVERYRRPLTCLVDAALRAPDLACINLGGGFGYDYKDPDGGGFPFDDLAEVAGEALRSLSGRLGRAIVLRVEPGRALVAGAGVLLTAVRSVKEGASRRYVGVDTTVANLTSPVVHGAHRRVVAIDERPPAARLADVCGATTFSRDFIGRDAELPAVKAGDLLAVLDAGAYGYCMSSHFLNRPRAAELFVDGGEARLVTRRETFEDLVAAQLDR